MRHIPRELAATTVSYAKEQSAGVGFMPGDNEAGVLIYPLPLVTVTRLRNEGQAYFDAMSPGWQDWEPTPVDDLETTTPEMAGEPERTSPLASFVNRFGVQIQVDPTVSSRIDRALTSRGSFYHRTPGGGIVLVTPEANEAYFIYAG